MLLTYQSEGHEWSSIALLYPFVDSEERCRIGGRLQYANMTSGIKQPILLPHAHSFTGLVVWNSHRRTSHEGIQDTITYIREVYWVSRERQVIKKVISRYNGCRRQRLQAVFAPTASLPHDRIAQGGCFEIVEIDFVGPLFAKTGPPEKKSCVALYTCAVTRVAHLGLVSSLNYEVFIVAFERITLRPGLPTVLYTDNAMTFKKAARTPVSCGTYLTTAASKTIMPSDV